MTGTADREDGPPLGGEAGSSRPAAEREAFFDAATAHTPLLAVETDHGLFVLSTEDGNVGRSLFISRTRGEFQALRAGMAALEAAGAAERARSGPFVDVGANIGTSIVAALCGFGFPRGVALEPEPANHRLLRLNVAANGLGKRVRTVKAAASNRSGVARLRLTPRKSGGHELRSSEDRKSGAKPSIKVKVMTLDQLVELKLVEADGAGLIWIDAQGEEGQVLAGASQLTEPGTPVILEVAPSHLAKHGGIDLLTAVAKESYSHLVDLRFSGRDRLVPIGELGALIDRCAADKRITDVLLLRGPARG